MKKIMFLFLPLLMVGAGCSSTAVETVEIDDAEGVVSEGMVIEGAEGVDDVEVIEEEVEDGEMENSDEDKMVDNTMTEEVSFDLDGFMFGYSVKEIRVKKGQKVTINFNSTEGLHDWVVDEFDAATEKINTGGSTSVTFVVDKEGTFEYYCSVGQHRSSGMVGKLMVE